MSNQATTATLAQNTAALYQLIADAQNAADALSANDDALADAKKNLTALIGTQGAPAQVVAQGQALYSQLNALADIQKDVENSMASFVNSASALRSEMETNPLYSFLQTPQDYWGSRQYDLINDLLARTVALIAAGTAVMSRAKGQNRDVAGAVSGVKSAMNAAAGMGGLTTAETWTKGILGSVSSGATEGLSKVIWPIAIVAAVAGVVYLTAPQMFRGRK